MANAKECDVCGTLYKAGKTTHFKSMPHRKEVRRVNLVVELHVHHEDALDEFGDAPRLDVCEYCESKLASMMVQNFPQAMEEIHNAKP